MKQLQGYKKGINIGGWFSQCEYSHKHFETFISESDFATIAAWGLDHVRIPVDSGAFTMPGGEYDEYSLALIDKAVKNAVKYKLNVVLDLHKTEGFAFDGSLGENNLLTSDSLMDKFVAIWEMLSERFSKYGDNIMFEPLNEIDRQDSTLWNKLILRTVKSIRNYAPAVKIAVGGVQWNSPHTLNLLDEPYDENIVFNFHFYEPFLFTHQTASWQPLIADKGNISYPGCLEDYRNRSKEINCFGSGLFNDKLTEMGSEFIESIIVTAVRAAEGKNVSLYCGEYGVIDQAEPADILAWYKDINSVFEKYGISRAVWTYKGLDFGLNGEHYSGIISELTNYL